MSQSGDTSPCSLHLTPVLAPKTCSASASSEQAQVGPSTGPGPKHHRVQVQSYQLLYSPGSEAQVRALHVTPRNINSEAQISHGYSAGKSLGRPARSREQHDPELGVGCRSSQAHNTVEWHNPLAEAGNRYFAFLPTGLLWNGANWGCRKPQECLVPREWGAASQRCYRTAGSEDLVGRYWLQKCFLMARTRTIRAMGNYQRGSICPQMSTPKCPQEKDCNT